MKYKYFISYQYCDYGQSNKIRNFEFISNEIIKSFLHILSIQEKLRVEKNYYSVSIINYKLLEVKLI